MYSTIAGTRADILIDLYDESTIDAKITETDALRVIPWIDGAVGRSFTEDDLVGADNLIRKASCAYNAYSIMSSTLEGRSVEEESLAIIRLKEAKEDVTMWCNANGITPTFAADAGVSTRNADYAYAVGSDTACIG